MGCVCVYKEILISNDEFTTFRDLKTILYKESKQKLKATTNQTTFCNVQNRHIHRKRKISRQQGMEGEKQE